MFINYDNKDWDFLTVKRIVDKVEQYVFKKALKEVKLLRVEDNTWADAKNRRYDIEISYVDDKGKLVWQKLLILKDEILDGEQFHKRFEEFYG